LIASVLGVFIALFLVWMIVMVMMIGMMSSLGSSKTVYTLTDNTVLQLNLHGSIDDRESTDFMAGMFGGTEKSVGLDDILKAIQMAKENDKILGIYIKLGGMLSGSASISTMEPIRNALLDFKESGKFVVAYGDYYQQSAIYLTSVADKVIMNPQGMFMWRGMATNLQFSKGMYDKLGIKYEVFRVGEFKAAVEPFTETKMSDANREQVTAYVNSIWTHLLSGISKSRGISVDNLNRYADEYMTFSAPEKSVEYGLVDTLMYATDVKDYMKKLAGLNGNSKIKFASVSNINSVPEKRAKPNKDKVAVLYAKGLIYTEDFKRLTPFAGEMITDETYVKEINKLKDDKNVKAVVLRVNSPGGSAFASEQIWHAITELKEEKPVIVSMGDMAASGGYYISCAADVIVAEPTTITGSIGGFSLIPEGSELHKKIGWSFDGVKTNKHSDMESASALGVTIRPYNNEERQIAQSFVNRFMDVFYTRCADGRSKTVAEIEAIGQGRVWTGIQALELGLVDRLGSLSDAVKIAAERAELENYDVVAYPKKRDPFAQLMEDLMGGGVKAAFVRRFLGDDVYRQYMMGKVRIPPVELVQALLIDNGEWRMDN